MSAFRRWLKSNILTRVESLRSRSARRRRNHSTESLETRVLLAADLGDAPDATTRELRGDYKTMLSNGGPSHIIDESRLTLFLGDRVDSEAGTFQSADAASDDRAFDQSSPQSSFNDEDGLVEQADLVATVGESPIVRVRVTNLTTANATLSGWLDINRNGVFENDRERVTVNISPGTDHSQVSLVFPSLPYGSAGTTYLRLRLSTDNAAMNPVGPALNGEVEDHRFVIQNKLQQPATFLRSVTIGDRVGGGPDIDWWDAFGWDTVPVGDINRDGVPDLVVSAPADGKTGTGSVYVLMMTTTGTVTSFKKIGHATNGGPSLAEDDNFGSKITSLGDLDRDGVTDIAVGARGDDTGGIDRGAVYIVYLTTAGTAKKVTKIASGLNGGPNLSDGAEFSSVEAIGDINRDGLTDLIVGAPFYREQGRTSTGASFLLQLRADGTARAATRIAVKESATIKYHHFGEELAYLGDIDGNGSIEVASLSVENFAGDLIGRSIDVLSLSADGTVIRAIRNPGETLGFYWSEIGMISNVGDLNGDGISDIGFVTIDSFDAEVGGSVIAFGTLNPSGKITKVTRVPKFTGPRNLQNSLIAAASISSLGDMNNDGAPEFAFGLPAFTIDYAKERIMGGISIVSLKGDLPKTSKPATLSVRTSAPASRSSETIFQWTASPLARTYEISLRDNITGATVTRTLDASVTSFKPDTPLPFGQHSFRIRAINELGASAWSAAKIVKADPPVITKSVASQFSKYPEVSWTGLDRADRYTIRIYDRKTGRLLNTGIVSSPTTSYVSSVQLPKGEYEFDVSAIAKDGTVGQWSPRMRFQTEVIAPVIRFARDVTTGEFTLRVSGLVDAESYEVEMARSDSLKVVRTESTSNGQFRIHIDTPAGSYILKFRPIGRDGTKGNWSVGAEFTLPETPRITAYPDEVINSLGNAKAIEWTNTFLYDYYAVEFRYLDVPNSKTETVVLKQAFYSESSNVSPGRLSRIGKYEVRIKPVMYSDGKVVTIGQASDPITITVRQNVTGVTTESLTSEIRWKAVPDTAKYEVEVVKTENGQDTVILSRVVTSNSLRPEEPLPMGSYKTRVRPISASGVIGLWSEPVTLTSRPRPVLTNPEMRWISSNATFQWQPIAGAVSYNLQLIHRTQVIANYRNISGTEFTPPSMPLTSSYNADFFEWTVSANAADNPLLVWSQNGKVSVNSSPADLVESPKDDGYRFTWSTMIDAVSYEIMIYNASNQFVMGRDGITITDQHLTGFISRDLYTVRVRGKKADGTLGRWAVRSFYA